MSASTSPKLPKITAAVSKVDLPVVGVNPADVIIDDTLNSRRYHEESIPALAEAMVATGRQLQPVILRRVPDSPNLLTVVAGFRRAKAIKYLVDNGVVTDGPLCQLEAKILDGIVDDRMAWEYNVSENLDRQDLSVIDQAYAMQSAMSKYGLSQKDAARMFGNKASWGTQVLALLKLPQKTQDMIHSGKIPYKAGYELTQVLDDPAVFKAALKAVTSRVEDSGAAVTVAETTRAVAAAAQTEVAAKPEKAEKLANQVAKGKRAPKELYDLFLNRRRELYNAMEDSGMVYAYPGMQVELCDLVEQFMNRKVKTTTGFWKKVTTLIGANDPETETGKGAGTEPDTDTAADEDTLESVGIGIADGQPEQPGLEMAEDIEEDLVNDAPVWV